jgi:hypothetical protein
MRRIAACAVGVLICGLAAAEAAPAPSTAAGRAASVQRWVRKHAANALLPPRSARDPADMKHPALLSLAWQVHKVVSPIVDAGTEIVVRDFEMTRHRGGVGPLTPASIAYVDALVLTAAAASIAKELGRPWAARAARVADGMPTVAKDAAASLVRAADAIVLEADKALRRARF